MATEPPPKPVSPSGFTRWLQWVGLCLIGLTAFVLLAAQAPPRIRLLGLFAILFGTVAGWGIGRLANRLSLSSARMPMIATVGVLLTAMLVGLTLESWRLEINRKHHAYFVESRKGVLASLWEHMEPELRTIYDRETMFTAYLHGRLTALKKMTNTEGDWADISAITFWLVEVSLGIAAGLYVFRQTVTDGPAQKNTAEPV